MTEYIEKTTRELGAVISAPKMTEKLLSRPPFRYLHDIVKSFLETNGFPVGLYTDDQLDHTKVADKEAKIEFLTLLVKAVEAATGRKTDAKPTKVVAGQEPENTNQLLQMLAACAALSPEKKAAAVAKAKGGSGGGGGDNKEKTKEPERKEKPSERVKETEEERQTRKEREKVAAKPPEEKKREMETTAATTDRPKEERKRETEEERRIRKEKERKERDEKEKNEKGKERKERDEREKNEKGKERKERDEREKNEKGKERKERDEKGKPKDDPQKEESEEERKRRHEDERRRRHEEKEREKQREKESDVPATAGRAPPRTKPTHEVMTTQSTVEPTPVANVIAEVRRDSDEKVEDSDPSDWLKVAEQYESRPSAPTAAVAEDVEVKGLLGQQALKAKKEQEEAARAAQEVAAPRDGGIVIRSHKSGQRTTGGAASSTMVDSELNKLREQLQLLTKACNPLGKFLEAIHDDIDSMTRELDTWRSEARGQALAAADARRQTEESLQEIQAQLQNLEDAISDQVMKTNNIRQNILTNDASIETMIQMVVGPDAGRE